jgi:hypothetical protein
MKKERLILLTLILFLDLPFSMALSTSSSTYQANILIGGSGGYSTSSTYNLDLLLGQDAIGITNSSNYIGYLGFFYGSYFGENINYLPDKVVLSLPSDDSSANDRTPEFSWQAAYDRNSDSLTYQFLLSKDETFTIPSDLLYNVTSLDALSYTIPSDLDIDTSYFWKVRANDSFGFGEFSDTWNHTVSSLQAIQLTSNSIDFKQLIPGNINDTTNNAPSPFVLRNTGNIDVNVTINASKSPFELQPLNTKYFQAETSNYESGSIDIVNSQIIWMYLKGEATSFIKGFNWEDGYDEARIDIKVEVPEGEPVGTKDSSITFEVES